MSYRLIALDLDGTLLDSQRSIREDSMIAIRRAASLDIRVMIVTGRHHTAAHYYWHQLGIDMPAICCNGAYVYDFNKNSLRSDSPPLNRAVVRDVLKTAGKHDVLSLVYTTEYINYKPGNQAHFFLLDWAKTLPPALSPQIRPVDSLLNMIEKGETIWKLILVSDDALLLDVLSHEITEKYGLSCERSGQRHLDIMSARVNKGICLAEVAKQYGISPKEVMAIGDQQNDVQMLKFAGLGVAMGNAINELKTSADWISASNDEGGVALALHRFALKTDQIC